MNQLFIEYEISLREDPFFPIWWVMKHCTPCKTPMTLFSPTPLIIAEQFSLLIASKAWKRTVCLLRAGNSSCLRQIGNSLAQNPVIGNTDGGWGFVLAPGGAAPLCPSFLNWPVSLLNSTTWTQNADTRDMSSWGSYCWSCREMQGWGTMMSISFEAHHGASTCCLQRLFFSFQNKLSTSITRFLLLVARSTWFGPICLASTVNNMSFVVWVDI